MQQKGLVKFSIPVWNEKHKIKSWNERAFWHQGFGRILLLFWELEEQDGVHRSFCLVGFCFLNLILFFFFLLMIQLRNTIMFSQLKGSLCECQRQKTCPKCWAGTSRCPILQLSKQQNLSLRLCLDFYYNLLFQCLVSAPEVKFFRKFDHNPIVCFLATQVKEVSHSVMCLDALCSRNAAKIKYKKEF